MSNTVIKVLTMSDMIAKGETPEILFWVGCSGSFDDRAKKITKAIVRILNHVNIKFAILIFDSVSLLAISLCEFI